MNVICNPNVHISRNHPEYVGCWKNVIFKERPSLLDNLMGIFNLIYMLFRTTIHMLFELLKLKSYRPPQKNIDCFSDLVLISHLVQNFPNSNDFYFANLQKELMKSGQKVFRLLIPHSGSFNFFTQLNNEETFLLREGIGKIDIVKYFFANLFSCVKLVFFLIQNKFGFYESVNILTGQIRSFSLFRLTHMIKVALINLRPKKVVFTFEGNALEKAVFYVCTQLDIESYGYQHAPIIESQHSIFQTLPKNLSPDIILCSGEYTSEKFRNSLGTNKVINILGSPKSINYRKTPADNLLKDKILLVPDGNKQSINTFINLSVFLAKSNSSRKIVIRAHPLFDDYLKTKIIDNIQLTKLNISLSKAPISQDLVTSSYLIYQNTSVCIQGLFNGCKLIYFEHDLANINPLWEFPNVFKTAHNFSDVSQIISFQSHLSIEEDINNLSSGQMYFKKFNPSILDQ
jgi:hypothetical protein